ncbi:MAG: hypothetical protein ACK5L8_06955 [Marinicella pacifica]
MKHKSYTFIALLLIFSSAQATVYHIGPGQNHQDIADVDWTALQAGDRVFIHWRSTPYREKWVINVQGTAQNPISIIGVNGPNGQQPVIDGENAVTVAGLNFWNESRGVIKIGGSNIPGDALPQHIIIENLDIRSAYKDYQFINDQGQTETYSNNAAAIYVEKAAHLTIRNCSLSNSGNGLFIGAFNGQTEDILIEKNHIHGNGVVGRIYEHNTYTAAIDITYQFNRFGPLKAGAGGNNLKDRSAGLVVAYNWIEGGNRQLDLVDAEDSENLVNHPSYHKTHVYGNVLIEPDNDGNSQIIHYGGDSGTTADYRKGTLFLYNNTIISQRSGNTTLVRLSTNDETAEVFNNIYYGESAGHTLALIAGNGKFNYQHNWLKTNYSDCHCNPNGTINNLGNQITGTTPDFLDLNGQNYRLTVNAPGINQGMPIPANLSTHIPHSEYQKHQQASPRPNDGSIDIGAYETIDLIFADGFE